MLNFRVANPYYGIEYQVGKELNDYADVVVN